MQVRGQSFGELQYLAQSLIETSIGKLEWDAFLPSIRVFTSDDSDAKTVLQMVKNAVITVTLDSEDEARANR